MSQDFNGAEIGATPTGWLVPTVQATRAAFVDGFRRLTRNLRINTEPGTFWGDLVDNANDAYQAVLQASAEGIAQTLFTSASGAFLARIVAPFTTPLPATASTADLTVYGNPGVDVVAGSSVAVTAASVPFETTAASGPLPAFGAGAQYAFECADFDFAAELGETFTLDVDGNPFNKVVGANDDAFSVVEDLLTQLSAAALQQGGGFAGFNPAQNGRPGGLVADSLGVPFAFDFTYTGASPLAFRYVAATVPSSATSTGPTAANPVTLREIQTPIPGWAGATNVDAAQLGRDEETDSALRLRHRAQLRTPGGRNPDAIRARVLLPVAQGGGGASFCVVEYNPDGATDPVGNVQHSIRVVVSPDDDTAAAAQAASLVKSGGDNTNGPIVEVVTDATGKTFPFRIDVLAFEYIWVEVEVRPGENWPAVGDPFAGVAEDVAAFIEALGSENNASGEDVRVGDLPISSFPDGRPRGVDQWRVRLAATPTPLGPPIYGPWFPTDTNDQEAASIAISSREKARGSVVRVFVSPL